MHNLYWYIVIFEYGLIFTDKTLNSFTDIQFCGVMEKVEDDSENRYEFPIRESIEHGY